MTKNDTNAKLADTINRLGELSTQLKQVRLQEKTIMDEQRELEQEAISLLDHQNARTFGTRTANAAIAESIMPAVNDWDMLFSHVASSNAWYLLRKQLNVTPYRELLNMGEELPGVTPVVQRKLTVKPLAK